MARLPRRGPSLLVGLLAVLAIVAAIGPPSAEAAAAPTVTSVAPTIGPNAGGTAITIAGTGFGAGAMVTVGGNPAVGITVVSGTQITATTPAGTPGAAVVTVTNADTQSGTLSNGFSYLANAPTIAGVNPANGISTGQNVVVITGTGFLAGATVTFGGTPALGVTVASSTQITAGVPAHTAGAVDVVVTNSDSQLATLVGGYTYTAAAPPTVAAASPNSGSTGGGTPITVTGTGFAAGATLTIGGVAATSVVVASATSITAVTPAHAAGAVAVVVTNGDTQGGTLGSGFTYVSFPAPTVTSIAPTGGPLAGGTAVTIAGTGFLPGATVDFGATAATSVVVVSPTQITANAPAGAAGAVAVKVTNTDAKNGTLAAAYTYRAAPTITSITPTTGPSTGGTEVTMTGSGFVDGATVTVGGVAATKVTFTSATSLKATTPAGTAGTANIVVTNLDSQTGTLAAAFTYVGGPVVSSLSPNSGPAEGGTTVVISGTGFVTGATVIFGSTAATSVTFDSATQLTAVSPAGSSGAVGVAVENPDGQKVTLSQAFTYEAGSGDIVSGTIPPAGFGLIVFGGGTNEELAAAATVSGCPDAAGLRFWATIDGNFLVFIPASQVQAVNAAWNAHFGGTIAANQPLISRCS